MLTRLYAHNYRSLLNFEFRPATVNLLVGRNGSGKTSLFDVLGGIQDLLVWDRGTSAAFPTETLTRSLDESRQRFELDVLYPEDNATLQYVLVLEHDRDQQVARIQQETLHFEGQLLFQFKDGEVQLYADDSAAVSKTFPYTHERSFIAALEPRAVHKKLAWFRTFMERVWLLNLDVRSMATSSPRESLFLDRRGENFASWYRYILQEQPDAISELNASLQDLMPGFRSLRAVASGRAKVLTATFSWPGTPRTYDIDFSALSEGQRALIFLYTLLHTVARSASVLCIDEPDNYVELAEIQPWLTRLSDTCRDADNQLLVISHHPEVIDYLAADHAWVFSRPDGGHTRVRSLEIEPGLEEGMKASEWLRGRYEDER